MKWIDAIESGDYNELKSLCLANEVPLAMSNGFSPLHHAIMKERDDMLVLLIEHGAKVNIQAMKVSITPLHLAADNGYMSCVKVLLVNGADPNLTDFVGDTPLHGAAQQGHGDVCSLLLEYGANKDAKNLKGETPEKVAKGSAHTFFTALKEQAMLEALTLTPPTSIQRR